MNLTLRIWRQKNSDTPGQFVEYKADDISPDMSFLEMLDVAVGARLTVYRPVRIERPSHAKYSGRISVKSARRPPCSSGGATRPAACRTVSGDSGMATPSPAALIISRSFS